jgi:hypothetical protein
MGEQKVMPSSASKAVHYQKLRNRYYGQCGSTETCSTPVKLQYHAPWSYKEPWTKFGIATHPNLSLTLPLQSPDLNSSGYLLKSLQFESNDRGKAAPRGVRICPAPDVCLEHFLFSFIAVISLALSPAWAADIWTRTSSIARPIWYQAQCELASVVAR